jgi:transcriptional regulator with GAF, ATPase, and Fis domain
LFLDEVAELSARVQAKLLRTLQEARFAGRRSGTARSMRESWPRRIAHWAEVSAEDSE